MNKTVKLQKLAFADRELYKNQVLSPAQHSLLTAFQTTGAMTPNAYAELVDISGPNADVQLSALYKRGYLTRTKATRPNNIGGFEYTYKLAKHLN